MCMLLRTIYQTAQNRLNIYYVKIFANIHKQHYVLRATCHSHDYYTMTFQANSLFNVCFNHRITKIMSSV